MGEASGSGSLLLDPGASFNEEKESHRGYSLGQKEVACSGTGATPQPQLLPSVLGPSHPKSVWQDHPIAFEARALGWRKKVSFSHAGHCDSSIWR